ERVSTLSLAIAQLDFDAQHEDVALETVTALQRDAHKRGAPSCEAHAAVLASRVLLAKSKQREALDVFDEVELDRLQTYRLQATAKIALGEIYGYMNEADENGVMGLDRIDDARDEAKKAGAWGVVLEAQL